MRNAPREEEPLIESEDEIEMARLKARLTPEQRKQVEAVEDQKL